MRMKVIGGPFDGQTILGPGSSRAGDKVAVPFLNGWYRTVGDKNDAFYPHHQFIEHAVGVGAKPCLYFIRYMRDDS